VVQQVRPAKRRGPELFSALLFVQTCLEVVQPPGIGGELQQHAAQLVRQLPRGLPVQGGLRVGRQEVRDAFQGPADSLLEAVADSVIGR